MLSGFRAVGNMGSRLIRGTVVCEFRHLNRSTIFTNYNYTRCLKVDVQIATVRIVVIPISDGN